MSRTMIWNWLKMVSGFALGGLAAVGIIDAETKALLQEHALAIISSVLAIGGILETILRNITDGPLTSWWGGRDPKPSGRLRSPAVVAIVAAALALVVSSCALFTSDTRDDCLAVKPMYDSYIETRTTPTLSEIGEQIDLCFAGVQRDSKAWKLALAVLKQALGDAWDDFRGSLLVQLFASGDAMSKAAAARADLEVQLEAYE